MQSQIYRVIFLTTSLRQWGSKIQRCLTSGELLTQWSRLSFESRLLIYLSLMAACHFKSSPLEVEAA